MELEQQTKWALKGSKSRNRTLPLLLLYQTRMTLAKLGFRYELDIPAWEMEAYMVIENTITRESNKDGPRHTIKNKL